MQAACCSEGYKEAAKCHFYSHAAGLFLQFHLYTAADSWPRGKRSIQKRESKNWHENSPSHHMMEFACKGAWALTLLLISKCHECLEYGTQRNLPIVKD